MIIIFIYIKIWITLFVLWKLIKLLLYNLVFGESIDINNFYCFTIILTKNNKKILVNPLFERILCRFNQINSYKPTPISISISINFKNVPLTLRNINPYLYFYNYFIYGQARQNIHIFIMINYKYRYSHDDKL